MAFRLYFICFFICIILGSCTGDFTEKEIKDLFFASKHGQNAFGQFRIEFCHQFQGYSPYCDEFAHSRVAQQTIDAHPRRQNPPPQSQASVGDSGSLQNDCQVLWGLFLSTNGPHWTKNAGWTQPIGDNATSCCSWVGISCLSERVFNLGMNGYNMSGTLPPNLGQLTALGILQLMQNNLHGPLPDLSNCTRLTVIQLSNNYFSGPIPDYFGSMSLNVLFLDNNQFSGPFPTTINGSSTTLTGFRVNNNWLTGPLPYWVPPTATTINLSNNRFTGPIPSFASYQGLTSLLLCCNTLSGNFPSEQFLPSSIQSLDITYNLVTGDVPAYFKNLTSLKTLMLTSNLLTGFDPLASGWSAIQALIMDDNAINDSSVLDTISTFKNLKYLDLSFNFMAGPVPSQLCNLPLKQLYMPSNYLTGPFCFTGLVSTSSIVELDVSNNQLTDAIMLLEVLPSLIYVDLSHNQFTEWTTLSINQITFMNPSSIVYLDFSYNNISSSFAGNYLVNAFPSLSFLDLSYNQFQGTLSESLASFSHLRTLRISESGLTNEFPCPSDITECLPPYLSLESTQVRDTSGAFFCFDVSLANVPYLELTPAVFNHSNCRCVPGYYGFHAHCTPCLPNAACTGNELFSPVVAKPGYWGSPDPESPLGFIACSEISYSEEICNPLHNSMGQPCMEGYTGRMCSDCEPGYYRFGGSQCHRCPSSAALSWAYIGLYVFIILLYLIYVYFSSPRSDATLTITLFFIQTLGTLTKLGLSLPSFMVTVNQGTSSISSFYPPGLECVIPSFGPFTELTAFLSLPFCALALVLLVYLIGKLAQAIAWSKRRTRAVSYHERSKLRSMTSGYRHSHFYTEISGGGDSSPLAAVNSDVASANAHSNSTWETRNLRVLCVLLYTLYFQIAGETLNFTKCVEDPVVTSLSFLQRMPFVQCQGPNMTPYELARISTARLSAFIYTAFWTVLVFAFFCWTIWVSSGHEILRNWGDRVPSLHSLLTPAQKHSAWFGVVSQFLTAPYREGFQLWSLTIIIRRLLLTISVSLVSFASAFLPFFIILILLAALVAHVYVFPFKNRVENVLETSSLLVLILNFVISLVADSVPSDPTTLKSLAIFALVLDVTLILCMVVVLITTRLKKRFRLNRN